ncbi:hypothetical protein [Marinomonas fungiae]|uniref:hypothetical protein n=1 Tax=Marinomonas fungiae TaxID=1137284 RepID=UPI003A928302
MSDNTQRFLQLETDQYSVYSSKALGDLFEGEDVTFTLVRKTNINSEETLQWRASDDADIYEIIKETEGENFDLKSYNDSTNVIYGSYPLSARMSDFNSPLVGDLTFAAGQSEASFTLSTRFDTVSGDYTKTFPISFVSDTNQEFSFEFATQDQQARSITLQPNELTQFALNTPSPIEISANLEAGVNYSILLDTLRTSATIENLELGALANLDLFKIYNSQGEDVTPFLPDNASLITFTPEVNGTYKLLIADEDRLLYELSITEEGFTGTPELAMAQDSTQVATPNVSLYELESTTNDAELDGLTILSTRNANAVQEGSKTIVTLERSENLDSTENFIWHIDAIEDDSQVDRDGYTYDHQFADWSDIDSALSGLLHFEAGETQASFELDIKNDQKLEFNAELINIVFNNINNPDGVLTTSIEIQDNETPALTMEVDDKIRFVGNDQVAVEISVELEAGESYFIDLDFLEGTFNSRPVYSITDNQGKVVAQNIAAASNELAFNVDDSGLYTFTVTNPNGEGLYDFEVYKDYQEEASQHLGQYDLSIADAYDFIIAALTQEQPELIYHQSQAFEISAGMLSAIVGSSVQDIHQFFDGQGFDSSVLS